MQQTEYLRYNHIRNINLRNSPLLINHLSSKEENIDIKNTYPAIRALKDETTSTFVNHFYNENENLSNLSYYLFQKINYHIMTNINRFLAMDQDFPSYIHFNEYVLLIFKGCNIIHFYYNTLINRIVNNNIRTNLQNNSNDFKISDIDFTIYILNNTGIERFNKIYYYVQILLYAVLIEIRESFENIFINNLINGIPNNINLQRHRPNRNYEMIEKDINIDIEFIINIENNILENLSLRNYQDALDFFNDQFRVNNRYKIFKDTYVGTIYIKIIQSLLYYYENNQELNNIIEYQRRTIHIELNNILYRMNNFYNRITFENFYNDIIQSLNNNCRFNANGNNKEYYNEIDKKLYQLSDEVMNDIHNIFNPNIQNDLNYVYPHRRGDLIIKNINDPFYNEMNIINNNNYHYISISSTINNLIKKDHIINFDLFRIKLNFDLKKIHNINDNTNSTVHIPSEFLDISIPKFHDYNLSKIREEMNHQQNLLNHFTKLNFNNNNNSNILSYNISYLTEDINVMLFKQNVYIPWFDKKYKKRLKRFIFLNVLLFLQRADDINQRIILTEEYNNLIVHLEILYKNLKRYFLLYNNNLLNPLNNNAGHRINRNNVRNMNNIIQSIRNNIHNFVFNDNNNILTSFACVKNFYKKSIDKYFDIKYSTNIFGNELDYTFDLILKIANFHINSDVGEDNFYYHFISLKMDQYSNVFNDEASKNEYINVTFIKEYLKFIRDLIYNLKLFNDYIIINQNNFTLIRNNIIVGGGGNNNEKKLKKNSNNLSELSNNERNFNKLSELSNNEKMSSELNNNERIISSELSIKSNNSLTLSGFTSKIIFKNKEININCVDYENIDMMMVNKTNKNNKNNKRILENTKYSKIMLSPDSIFNYDNYLK